MFLDVSGFTRITELATSRGHYGVEVITGVLNHYFEGIQSEISHHGGEIVKFGGDACLILFVCESRSGLPNLPLIRTAILEMTARLDQEFRNSYGFRFRIHGAMGAGKIWLNIVGSASRHLDYYFESEALEEVYTLAETAAAGEIIAPDWLESPTLSYCDAPQTFPVSHSRKADLFLPTDVHLKLSQEKDPAELRNATVIFIRLSPDTGNQISLMDYQTSFIKIQAVVYNHQGVINKIDCNEKGYLILALFGTPFVRGNDTRRAFTAAYRLTELRCPNVRLQIGITYSNIFCGIIGARTRREYGIIGNAVNIAARLMSYAGPGDVCLTSEIIPRLEGAFETEYLADTTVKGIEGTIEIHRLVREMPQRWNTYSQEFANVGSLVASDVLAETSQALAIPSELFCQIYGGPGTGKSLLLWKLCESMLSVGIPFTLVPADPYVRDLRLEFFFQAMRTNLDILHFRQDFDHIVGWCAERDLHIDPVLLYRFLFEPAKMDPLLASSENEIALTAIFDIMALVYQPDKALVVDNLDCFDPQSRDIIARLARRNLFEGGKILISSNTEELPELKEGFRNLIFSLENWNPDTCMAYIRNKVPNATPKASELLRDISHGNPQFLTELVTHINDHFAASEDLITDEIINAMRHQGLLPDSLENLLRADYEKLQPQQQELAKNAAIYGRPFTITLMDSVFPPKAEESTAQIAESLCGMSHFRRDFKGSEMFYAFSNPLMMESIYRSILLREKIHLHESIARHQEKLPENVQDPDIIAHHYARAQNKAKINVWCRKLAAGLEAAGALELALRQWEDICANPLNPEIATDASLHCARIMLLLADNDEAAAILERHSELLHAAGPFHDRYVYLKSRLLINRASWPELRVFLKDQQTTVRDGSIKTLLALDYCESLSQAGDPDAFFAYALPLHNDLRTSRSNASAGILAGIIAGFYSRMGNYQEAIRYFRDKLVSARAIHDPIHTRIALNGLGNSYSRSGQKEKALKFYQVALETAEKSGDRNGYSKTLLNLGVLHRNDGNYEAAFNCYEKSLKVAKLAGNKQQVSIIIYDMGELLYYQEKWEEAEVLIRQALEIALQIGDTTSMSFCYDALGDIVFRYGRLDEAKQIYLDNIRLQHRIHDMEGLAHSVGNLGNIAKMNQNYPLAKRFYRRQIDILASVEDWDGSGRAWFNLAMLDRELKDPAAALEKLNKAMELFERCKAQYFIDITRQQIEELAKESLPSNN
jgi:class 3 adenylate cyclase/tetratricopeptide (TPR) repeat protein